MNTVGATDAAGAAIPVAGGPTSRVTDSALYEMATVEFAAPKGIQPWEGKVILNEHLGSDLQSTWVSSLIGAGVISIDKNGQAVDIELLESREELSEFDRRLIDILMPGGATSRRVYKKFTESFATTWKEIREALIRDIKEKNWWNKPLRAWNKRTSMIGVWISAALLLGLLLLLDSVEKRVGLCAECVHGQRGRRRGGGGRRGVRTRRNFDQGPHRVENSRGLSVVLTNRIIPEIPCTK
jgi:hypothetical protein